MSDPDPDIHAQVTRLVSREHALREHLEGAGPRASHDHRQELRSIEEALDVCWDLLRQRQARRSAGQDPAGADARPRVRSRATCSRPTRLSGSGSRP